MVAVVAEKKIDCFVVIIVCIHEFESDSDSDATEGAEKDICEEEHLCLLPEERCVVPEAIDVSFRHVIQVDQIVEPVKTEIEDLSCQDEKTKQAEYKRVKMQFATAGPNHTDKQGESKKVEYDPHHSIVNHFPIVSIVISCGRAPVCHNAECQEMTVGAEKQVNIDAGHIMEYKLIDHQVYELSALKANEPLDFRAALDRALIVDQPSNHKLSHNTGLDANPDFLDNEPWRTCVFFVLRF